jgi:hypothetical protein
MHATHAEAIVNLRGIAANRESSASANRGVALRRSAASGAVPLALDGDRVVGTILKTKKP